MTKPARNEERRTRSGERPSVKAMAVAPVADIGEEAHRRRPRTVNRPAKATSEGYVTLGYRGTKEDDDAIRQAVEIGGFYSKADLIKRATEEFVAKVIAEGGDHDVRKLAAKLGDRFGVDPKEVELLFESMARKAAKKQK